MSITFKAGMNKELKQFYIKKTKVHCYIYTEPKEYEKQLIQLLIEFVEKNKTDLKLIEIIIKEIEKKDRREEAVGVFLQPLVVKFEYYDVSET